MKAGERRGLVARREDVGALLHGEIAGAGLFDLSALFGKSDADNRQFLQVPRFVARIEALAATKKK